MIDTFIWRLELFGISGFGQDYFMAFGIVRQFFNNSRNQARRELRGCFLKGGSDILDRATPAISLEGADQLLDAGLPGGFLADQRVA